MKHLRQYIRQVLLTEAAKQPEDLDVGHKIIRTHYDPVVTFSLVWQSKGSSVETGKITITQDPHRNGPCSDAWEVISASARHGFGPLLYDLAMEYAGSDGMMADRRSVSADAWRVWNFYLNSRPDVKPKQLDLGKHSRNAGFLTPDNPNDDCRQDKFLTKYWVDNPEPFDSSKENDVDAYLSSPLTKAFVKTGTPTTDKLKEMGKLIVKDDW